MSVSPSKPFSAPTSFGQDRLWFLQQFDPGSASYNMWQAFDVEGELDGTALAAALAYLCERHESFRTTFEGDGSELRQLIWPELRGPFLAQHDLRGDATPLASQRRILNAAAAQRFDLAAGPLAAFHWIRMPGGQSTLMLAAHHIICDGWSLNVFFDELCHAYAAFAAGGAPTLAAPKLRYADFAAWQRERLKGRPFEKLLGFWSKTLDGAPPEIALPFDRTRPAVVTYNGDYVAAALPAETEAGLKRLAAETKSSPFAVLLGLYGAMLARYGCGEDVVIGMPATGRTKRDLEGIVGFFVNTLPLRLRPARTLPLLDHLAKARAVVLDALANGDMPFELLVDALKAERSVGRHPILQTVFSLETARRETRAMGAATLRPRLVEAKTAKFDLSMIVHEDARGWSVGLNYNTDLFDRASVERMSELFGELVGRAVRGERGPLGSLPLTAMRDAFALVTGGGDAHVETTVGRIEAQMRRVAERPAATFAGETWTYAELDRRSAQVAAGLRAAGARRGERIGIHMRRSLDLLAAMLGVWRAGCAYVPLDPSYPAARNDWIARDAGMRLALADQNLTATVAAWGVTPLDPTTLAGAAAEDAGVTPHDLAYVIYTSGSTGQPKGVQIGHASLDNFMKGIRPAVAMNERDVLLAVTSISFDISLLELFLPLALGGHVVIASERQLLDPEGMSGLLRGAGVTVLQMTPAGWKTLNDAPWRAPAGFKALCGGEPLPPELATELLGRGARVFNLYGPTETTVWSTAREILGDDARIRVGVPLRETRVYVLGDDLEPKLPGVYGEVFLGGDGLALGYGGRPDLTAERFLPDPFSDEPGARMYRTGDVGRITAKGQLEIGGRVDFQVKIRGFRIELGEIEAALAKHPAVRQAVVHPQLHAGETVLVAYCTFRDGAAADVQAVRQAARAWLPEHMLPTHVVAMDAFPLTPNKKVDRKLLPKVEPAAKAPAPPAAAGDDARIVAIWREVLQRDEIDPEQSFFDQGGTSLQVVKLHRLVKERLAAHVSVADLFANPSVRAFARLLAERSGAGAAAPRPAPRAQGAGQRPRQVAIVGLAVRMPFADDADEFWEALRRGTDAVAELPAGRHADAGAVAASLGFAGGADAYTNGSYLRALDRFDWDFFHMSPNEARLTDPNQRLFLETAYCAIEDAGFAPHTLDGSRTGIFVGFNGTNGTLYRNWVAAAEPDALKLSVAGTLPPVLASRLAYLLNLTGPAMMIDTACSSGLVAAHLACQAIRSGEIDLAVAGAIKLNVLPLKAFKGGWLDIIAADGRTRAFDDLSTGTGTGEGVAALVLKPLDRALADRDQIYGVIAASGVNQDGRSSGMTAPNANAQTALLQSVWDDAGVDPRTITYVEAHGTGTKLGDPIEVDALTRAFAHYTSDRQFCGIGSLKSNLGHLDTAAGMAGLAKLALALKHRELPPTLHFTRPNRHVRFEESPLYVNHRLRPWTGRDGAPLRAGISSFGLSGTNGHLLLEEAPAAHRRVVEQPNAARPRLLLLSARSRAALRRVAARLERFVARSAPHLDSLCFTANTGRAQHPVRLAMTFMDDRDLLAKLAAFGDREGDAGLPFGECRVVSGDRAPREGEILAETAAALTAEAAALVGGATADADTLEALARLFVSGARLELAKLYDGAPVQRISLPTYPFEPTRSWVTAKAGASLAAPKPQAAALAGEDVGHPLLQRRLADLPGRRAYGGVFTVESQWVLGEHKVGGHPLAVGTTYVEMLHAAAALEWPDEPAPGAPRIEIRNLIFLTPLVMVQGEERLVQVVVEGDCDARRAVVMSRPAGQTSGPSEWAVHAEAELARAARAAPPARGDLAAIRAHCTLKEVVIDYSSDAARARRAVDVGDRWRSYKTYVEGESEALAEFELAKAFEADLTAYRLHPALLDIAVNAGNPSDETSTYLPFGYRRLVVHDRLPRHFFSHLRFNREREARGETIGFDIALLAADGRVLAEIEGFTIKKVRSLAALRPKTGLFQRSVWEPLPAAREAARPGAGAPVVAVLWGAGAPELRVVGTHVIRVEPGERFVAPPGDRWTVAPDEASYRELAAALGRAGVSRVVDATAVSGASAALLPLFRLAKALAIAPELAAVSLDVLTCGAVQTSKREIVDPYAAAVLALAKVVDQEYDKITCHVLDLAPGTAPATAVATALSVGPTLTGHAALRDGVLYGEVVKTVALTGTGGDELAEDGRVYVITGGLGGLGIELARWLARRARVKLALLGRRPPDDAAARQLDAIDGNGSAWTFVRCDVGDAAEVAAAFARVRHELGRIDGVFHAAGVAGDGYVLTKPEATFRATLRPKIDGTEALLAACAAEPPRFVVLFSSIAALLGGVGQSDYAAANAYLEGVARSPRGRELRCHAIGWAAWAETGMAVAHGVDLNGGVFKALRTDEALEAMLEVVRAGADAVTVGRINHEVVARSPHSLPFEWSDEIKARLRRVAPAEPGRADALPQVRLVGADAFTPTETTLAAVWGAILGFDTLDVHQSFFEAGGDSILATQIANKVGTHLGVRIDIGDVFNNLTIAALAKLIDGRRGAATPAAAAAALPPLERTAPAEHHPATPAQRRFFLMAKMDPGSTAFNLPEAMIVEGALDRARFEQALHRMTLRHEALRTALTVVDGEVRQVVAEAVAPALEWLDREGAAPEAAMAGFVRPFEDLARPPLFRTRVVRLGGGRTLVLTDKHHLIYDGISMNIFWDDFFRLYRGDELPPLPFQYHDYAAWTARVAEGSAYAAQEAYWERTFADAPPPLALPTDRPRPPRKSAAGHRYRFALPPAQASRLAAWAKARGTTLFAPLLAAIGAVLARYGRQREVVVGTVSEGRRLPEAERMLGLFLNSLPLRLDVSPGLAFGTLVDAVKATLLDAFRNQDYPVDELIRKLRLRVDPSRSPLFDVMVIYHSYKRTDVAALADGLAFQPLTTEATTSPYDLTFYIVGEDERGITLEIEYATALFDEATIARLGASLSSLLAAALDDDAKPVAALPLQSAAESAAFLRAVGAEARRSDQPFRSVLARLDASVAAHADQPAVTAGATTLTYAALDRWSRHLAARLRALGVGRGDRVAVLLNPGEAMLAALLGVLRAGAAYVPIDPKYPLERQRFVLQDSGAKVVVATEAAALASAGAVVLAPGTPGEAPESAARTRTDDVDPRDAAYVIYTSGTTGRPKGVVVEHRNLAAYLDAFTAEFALGAEDVVLQQASFAFDTFVEELYPALLAGGRIVVVSRDDVLDPDVLDGVLRREGVTAISVSPLVLNELNKRPAPPALRLAISGGDVLKPHYVDRLAASMRIYNTYGPTETTVCATYHRYGEQDQTTVPIGRAIRGYDVYVMDEALQPCPVGVPGEIYIGGAGVARGYLGRPELTAAVFVPHPFAAGERLYRSGDLGRWRADGTVEFLGRVDHQVKIRGYRIETKEIERRIVAHPAVHDAVVVVRGEDGAGQGGEKTLVAYYVADGLDARGLRAHLTAELPDFMVPTHLVAIDRIPLTVNNKVDLRALPEPAAAADRRDVVRPSNDVEARIAAVWTEMLGVADPDVGDSFFEVGGNSLVALSLVARLKSACGFDVPVGEVFRRPTIRELAQWVIMAGPRRQTRIARLSGRTAYRAGIDQEDLFRLHRQRALGATYNIPIVLRIRGALDEARLQAALELLTRRHEALRCSFQETAQGVMQVLHDDVAVVIERAQCRAEDLDRAIQAFVRPFDLTRAPLIRFGLFRLEAGEHAFLFDVHHINADARTVDILLEELLQLLEHLRLETRPLLAPAAAGADPMTGFLREEREAAATQGGAAAASLDPVIAELWIRVLGAPPAGPDASFFECGGSSLQMTTLLGQLRARTGVAVSVAAFVRRPTPGHLTERVRQGAVTPLSAPVPEPARRAFPMTSAQQAIFVAQASAPSSLAYNVPESFLVEGSLDRARLRAALARVAECHATLRSAFKMRDDGAFEQVVTDATPQLEELRASDLESAVAAFVRPFDLGAPPLLRAAVADLADGAQAFLVDVHHVAADGLSLELALDDLMAAYDGRDLPALPYRFGEHAAWLEQFRASSEYAAQSAVWRRLYTGFDAGKHLPTEYPRALLPGDEGGSVRVSLEGIDLTALDRLAAAASCTRFALLLAAYGLVVSRFQGDADVCIGVPSDGRTRDGTAGLVGMLVNTLAVRLHAPGSRTFADYLAQVRDTLAVCLDRQEFQYTDLVQALGLTRAVGVNPLFQAALAFEDFETGERRGRTFTLKPRAVSRRASIFDMTLVVRSEPGRLDAVWVFKSQLYRPATVERLAAAFAAVLLAAVRSPETPLERLVAAAGGEGSVRLALDTGAKFSPLPVQQKDVSAWERVQLVGPDAELKASYWRAALKGAPGPFLLPYDQPQTTTWTYDGAVVTGRVDAEAAARLRRLAPAEGVTTFMWLFATLAALPSLYGEAPDVILGTPWANRHHEDMAGVVGMFRRLVPVRCRPRPGDRFAALLQDVKRSLLGAVENQLPPSVVAALTDEAGARVWPHKLQMTLAHQKAAGVVWRGAGLEIELHDFDQPSAKYEVLWYITETAGDILIAAHYPKHLFSTARAQLLVSDYAALLRRSLETPGFPLADLRSARERKIG